MCEAEFFHGLLIAWFCLAAVVFVFLFFVTAPYGRHTRGGWGPRVDRRLGWILMESPTILVFLLFFLLGDRRTNLWSLVFLAMWLLHYIHRTLIYPFQMRGPSSHMTLLPALMGIVFNLGNSYLNARYLFTLGPGYQDTWLTDPRFLIGVFLFFAGFIINRHSDSILKNLRKPGEATYRIPQGGLYRYISCPNYLGEIVEWFGWALATWSLAGLSFAVWTAANLVPRAFAHHKWYRQEFKDYPTGRKAIIPFFL